MDRDNSTTPHVTHVLREVVDVAWNATEWHLQRGQANHACYAMLARGADFDADPLCEPWIDGWRKWVNEIQPEIEEAEVRIVSRLYNYVGTMDLLCIIDDKATIVDFKNSVSPLDQYQMAAYAQGYKETEGWEIKQVVGVQISGDGGYKMGKIIKGAELRKALAGWLAIREVYRIKKGV